ncbi:MAG: transporter [Nonomuraea sp.]|nr:transporter [Nonomuraea sp.]NUT12431.1 transporter [Nonomuraea sp.]
MVDDDHAPTPEETLRLIEQQRTATVRRLHGDPLLIYVPWGVAWLLGFMALFLHHGLGGVPYVPITLTQALAVLFAGMSLAGAIAIFGFARMGEVRGESSAKGMMYGFTWMVAMLSMTMIAVRLSPSLSETESGLLWGGGFMLMVAVLYMVGGAVWMHWPMFFVGAWTAAVNGLGFLLGVGWHALLTSVLVGGGFIAAGLWLRRRM